MKKNLIIFLKFLISLTLLSYLFVFSGIVDVHDVMHILKQTRLSIFILVLFIWSSAVLIATKRWSLFLPEGLPYSRLVSLVFISHFFNTFLPGRVGGEIVRTFYIYRDTGKGNISLASVFMDKYLGFSGIACISFMAFIGGYAHFSGTDIEWLIPAGCGIFLIASIMFWEINWGKIKSMSPLYTQLMEYKMKKGIILRGLVLSCIMQVISIVEVYLLSLAIGITVPIIYVVIFVPIINAVSAMPVTMGGLGLREVGFATLFSMFFTELGVTSDQAVSLSLLIFLVLILVNAIGGIEYLRIRKLPVKEKA